MNTQHNMEESLWNFIDGTISASEKIVVEKLLQTDADWKAKYGELLQVNELLQSSGFNNLIASLTIASFDFCSIIFALIPESWLAAAAKTFSLSSE